MSRIIRNPLSIGDEILNKLDNCCGGWHSTRTCSRRSSCDSNGRALYNAHIANTSFPRTCPLHARVTDHFFFLSSINCCTNATGTVRAGPPIVATHSHRPPVPLQHFASPVATADTSCSSQRETCVPQLCLMQALQVCTKNLHTGFARDRLRDSYSHKQILPTHGSSLPVAAVPSAKTANKTSSILLQNRNHTRWLGQPR